jgi:hypothetical protein
LNAIIDTYYDSIQLAKRQLIIWTDGKPSLFVP